MQNARAIARKLGLGHVKRTIMRSAAPPVSIAPTATKSSSSDIAEKFWDEVPKLDLTRGFWSNPFVNKVATDATGGRWFLEYVRDKYFGGKPAKSALSVGCGIGDIDRIAYQRGIFERVTGVDFSAGSIETARTAAAAENIPATYIRTDFNVDGLPKDQKFALIFDYASSHHVENLERLYLEIERTLADDGYFVLYGYCGPARMQWTAQTIELVDELLSRMPARLKPMSKLERPTIWAFLANDPSEAVRGPEVVDVARAVLDVVEEIEIGWTLSHPMFSRNSFEFDPQNPHEQALIHLVCEYERQLLKHHIIPSDNKVLVCRRRAVDPCRPARSS
jgi:SAM-dependent methyltransferase